MEQRVQKDRYLHLNGDKVEHPRWKNLALSATFLACVGSTALTLLYAEKKPSTTKKGIIFAGGAGLFLSRAFRKIAYLPEIVGLFSSGHLTTDSVIDTQPSQKNTPHQNKLVQGYLDHATKWGGASLIAATFTPPTLLIFEGGLTSPTAALILAPIVVPIFSEGLSTFYRAHKLKSNSWTIIDKDKMRQEQTEEEPSTRHHLALN